MARAVLNNTVVNQVNKVIDVIGINRHQSDRILRTALIKIKTGGWAVDTPYIAREEYPTWRGLAKPCENL